MPVLRAPVKGQKLVLSFGKPSVKGIKYLPLPTDFRSQKVSLIYKTQVYQLGFLVILIKKFRVK
jgi:hypothetical protein